MFKRDEDVIFMIELSRFIDKAIKIENKIYGYRNNHSSLTSKSWKSLARVYDCIRLAQRIQEMIACESDAVYLGKLINRFRISKNAVYGEMKACGDSNMEVLKQIHELRLHFGELKYARLSFRDKARELLILIFPFVDSYLVFRILSKIRNLARLGR